MGSYDWAEVCELVGLFLLNKLATGFGKDNVGLYRDDGLLILKGTGGRQADQARKKLHEIFKEHELRVTAEINHYVVNFLDVTLNLSEENYQPYRKPNNDPLYVDARSNHLPTSSSKNRNQSASAYPRYFPMKNLSVIIYLYTKMLLNAAHTTLNLPILINTTKVTCVIAHICFNPPTVKTWKLIWPRDSWDCSTSISQKPLDFITYLTEILSRSVTRACQTSRALYQTTTDESWNQTQPRPTEKPVIVALKTNVHSSVNPSLKLSL